MIVQLGIKRKPPRQLSFVVVWDGRIRAAGGGYIAEDLREQEALCPTHPAPAQQGRLYGPKLCPQSGNRGRWHNERVSEADHA